MVHSTKNNTQRPDLFIQSYMQKDTVLSVNIVRYDDLAKFVEEKVVKGGDSPGPQTWQRCFNPADGTYFISVPFNYLEKNGVKIYRPKRQE